MSDLIARTKIIPPRRRADLLTRPRLVELLTDLLGHRLILLVAPAGYGKTSLLVDFAHTVQFPVCWLALDTLDNDSYRFFSHLIASLSQSFPAIESTLRGALQAFAAGQGPLNQFLTLLVNELYEHADDEYLVVLDDYHLVADNEEISTFLSRFAQQIDDRCHIVLSARRLVGLPDMPLLVARGYISGLDFEDLAFSESEVQQLVLQNYGQSLSENEAGELVKATEGWITGLLLSAQSRLRNLPERVRRLRAAGVDLYDYLAQQVLDQQTPELRDFLLRTAALEEFDADLCAQVFPDEWLPPSQTWAMLIDALLEGNLFVAAVGEDGNWVRYHHLFQEFLEKQLARERPDEEVIILRNLAQYQISMRQWEKAYRAYQKLGDFTAIAQLLQTAGSELFHQDRILLLHNWLTAMPVPLLHEQPALLSLQGAVMARRGQIAEGLVVLDQAVAALSRQPISVDLGYALVRRSVIYRLLGDESAALADVERALALVEELDSTLPAQQLHSTALKAIGILLSDMGRRREGLRYLRQALDTYQALGDEQNEAATLQELARVHMTLGNYGESLELFTEALQAIRRLGNLSSQAMTLNNLGVLYHIRGDYDKAIDALTEAHLAAEHSGYARFTVYSLTSLGDLFVDIELWEAARNVYRQALVGANKLKERFLTLYLELALAQLATILEQWEQAFTRLDTAVNLLGGRTSGEGWARYQLAIGLYYLASGRASDAINPLQDAAERFVASESQIEHAIALFYLAAAYGTTQDITLGQRILSDALAAAEQMEARQPLLTALRSMKKIFVSLAEGFSNKPQLERFLEELTQVEQEIPLISHRIRQHSSPLLQGWLAETPPRLIIRALGRAEVLLDGRLIANRDWQTQSARDLFFCFLAHPDGLTREQVGALFWPDASPNDVKTRFKNSIYRLRSVMPDDVIRFENELYYFNRSCDYEYDVENFKYKLAQAAALSDPALRIPLYASAVELYRGAYLADIESGWAFVERAELEQAYMDALMTLAELQLAQGDHRAAIATCQQALEQDPCLEDAHRLIMRIYGAIGNRAGIVRQYRLCQQVLREELDVPPSPQTTDLYALLTH